MYLSFSNVKNILYSGFDSGFCSKVLKFSFFKRVIKCFISSLSFLFISDPL